MPREPSIGHRRFGAAITLAAALATGCAATSRMSSPVGQRSRPVVAQVAAPATTASTASTIARLPGLQVGDSGPGVLALEQRLAALHYDVGTPDGHFGPADSFAVIAFEKVQGMDRTGRATDDVLAALAKGGDPAPLVAQGGAMRIEVDLARQVLFLYERDQLARILPVSTGSGQRYCVQGQCDMAVTPGGSYRIGVKILGLQISRLGQLYNPLYFNGGIAIHGEPEVPNYPASHGCVRIPMNSSLWFFNEVPSGTPVYVIGGPIAPVPFREPAPAPPPAPPPPAPPPPPPLPPPPPTSTTALTTTTTVSTTTTTTKKP